jgi:hypothetical protein
MDQKSSFTSAELQLQLQLDSAQRKFHGQCMWSRERAQL